MSINATVDFNIFVQGDGAATTVALPLASSPFSFGTGLGGGNAFAGTFDLLVANPTGVQNVGSSPSIASAALDSTGTNLLLTFSSAPPGGGTITQVSGQFLF